MSRNNTRQLSASGSSPSVLIFYFIFLFIYFFNFLYFSIKMPVTLCQNSSPFCFETAVLQLCVPVNLFQFHMLGSDNFQHSMSCSALPFGINRPALHQLKDFKTCYTCQIFRKRDRRILNALPSSAHFTD